MKFKFWAAFICIIIKTAAEEWTFLSIKRAANDAFGYKKFCFIFGAIKYNFSSRSKLYDVIAFGENFVLLLDFLSFPVYALRFGSARCRRYFAPVPLYLAPFAFYLAIIYMEKEIFFVVVHREHHGEREIGGESESNTKPTNPSSCLWNDCEITWRNNKFRFRTSARGGGGGA